MALGYAVQSPLSAWDVVSRAFVAVGLVFLLPRVQGSGQGRGLRAAPACGLQYGGSIVTFSQCSNFASDVGEEYNLLWKYIPSAPAAGTLEVAIDAPASSNSWVGFGIPRAPGVMIGASAVIVKTDATAPSGASGQQYLLNGYSASQVRPGGALNVENLTVAFENGRLQALLTLPQTASSAGSIPILVAYGPLSASGGLRQHTAASGEVISIAAPVPSGGAPLPAAPPITALAAPAPQPLAQILSPANVASSEGPAAPAGSPIGGDSPEGGATCTLTAPDAAPLQFGQCQPLTGAAPDFTLLWRVNEPSSGSAGGRRLSAANSSRTSMENVTLGINVAKGSGWAAVGVPASPGQMVGSSVVFFRICPNCPTGATADSRYLAGKSQGAVLEPGRFQVDNIRAWAADGRLQGTFNVLLASSALAGQPLIFASGPVSSSGAYQYHGDGAGGVTVDLLSGSVSADDASREHLSTAHGVLMAVSWGFLIPLGAVIARNFKALGSTWFNAHRVMQTFGWLLGWAGLGIGVYITDGPYLLHQGLGIAIQVLGSIQIFLGVFGKPRHTSRWRRSWNISHWWVGRVAIGLAIANVYIGLIDMGNVETRFIVAYSVVLGAIVATAFMKETYDYLSLPPPAEEWQGKPPGYLSADPATAAKPYAGLKFWGGHGSRPVGSLGRSSASDKPLKQRDGYDSGQGNGHASIAANA